MYITYIGSDYYGVPPESKANGIIIPVAAVTVIAVGVSAVVMVYAQESREKKERAAARLAKKRALKTVPNYDIQEVPSNSDMRDGQAAMVSEDVAYGDHNHSNDSQALNNNHEHKKRFGASTTAATPPSVNHFHLNGNISDSSTLPPLSSKSNMTAVTTATTTSVLSTDNQEPYNPNRLEFQHHYQQEQQQQQQHYNQPQQQQQQYRSFDESEEDARKRRKKEKKKEKKRLLLQQRQQQLLQEEGQQGFELHDNHGFDTSAMTVSENSATPRDLDTIPTFTVQRRGDVVV
ncbi:hypothetical protein ElyMa_004007800 [Elysia marginata]|uniref:Uncharacterized protein n=1 Tax=Elysia marginata TaxID=1093978 RepID=A0AAV4G333_9GAST|nr:hypothetical protein ElyMa_004007800 [Elysia marginata]